MTNNTIPKKLLPTPRHSDRSVILMTRSGGISPSLCYENRQVFFWDGIIKNKLSSFLFFSFMVQSL